MSGGALGLEAPVVEAESGKLSLIHRESEKAYSRKPIFRIMNPYPIGPTGSSFPRCAPVLWAMHLATRLDGYSAADVRGWRLTSAKPRSKGYKAEWCNPWPVRRVITVTLGGNHSCNYSP